MITGPSGVPSEPHRRALTHPAVRNRRSGSGARGTRTHNLRIKRSEYEAVYGRTAELPYPEWEGHDPQWLTADQFETVWAAARHQIQASSHRPMTIDIANSRSSSYRSRE